MRGKGIFLLFGVLFLSGCAGIGPTTVTRDRFDYTAAIVVYGAIPRGDKEVAILTRSFLETIVDLASDIEVPAAHVAEKRVSPTHMEKTKTGETILPLVRIQSSSEKPGDAFISVRYRDVHFWVDDKDLGSKTIFSFLMFISTLVETGDKGTAPIVTIPTN